MEKTLFIQTIKLVPTTPFSNFLFKGLETRVSDIIITHCEHRHFSDVLSGHTGVTFIG